MTGEALFRADADPSIGVGHFLRSLTLATAWVKGGGSARLLTTTTNTALTERAEAAGVAVSLLSARHPDPRDLHETEEWIRCSSPSWLVLDGYSFDAAYHEAARTASNRLLVIEDWVRLDSYDADILLDQNLGAEEREYPVPDQATALLGPHFALVGDAFAQARPDVATPSDAPPRVLLTLGGSDPGSQTERVISVLGSLDIPGMEVTAVVGAASPNAAAVAELVEHLPGFSMVHGSNKMEELMAWATVAVAAGGSTMWELACMRVPFLILAVADNQIYGANAMSSAGAALNLGWYAQVTDSDMQNALERLLTDPVLRSNLSERSGDLVDGLGAARVADRMRSA